MAFYGDLILSRACHEEMIVLWRVEGFNSEDPPPSPNVAPTAHDPRELTRSAFVPKSPGQGQAQYTRLLQLHTPGCGPQFFMRFGLFHQQGHHPMLGFCNAASRIQFWDLVRISEYHEYMAALAKHAAGRDDNADRPPRPVWLRQGPRRRKAGETLLPPLRGAGGGPAGGGAGGGGGGGIPSKLRAADSNSNNNKDAASDKDSAMSNGTPDAEASSAGAEAAGAAGGRNVGGASAGGGGRGTDWLQGWDLRHSSSDPHQLVSAHSSERLIKPYAILVGRQVAWSPEGRVVRGGGEQQPGRGHAAVGQGRRERAGGRRRGRLVLVLFSKYVLTSSARPGGGCSDG